MACVIYSTGKSDFSIASRVGAKIDDYASQGKVYTPGIKLISQRSRGWQEVYISERRRSGKSRAGHYTTIIK